MAKVESPFVIPPHKYQELTQPDTCYYIIVTKEDEAKVKEAMKHYPEIEVAGYAEWFMNIVAVPGEVKFVGGKKTPPIRWEARRDSATAAHLDRIFNNPIKNRNYGRNTSTGRATSTGTRKRSDRN